jgi:membrane protein YdbS with pleckstrin-like domain
MDSKIVNNLTDLNNLNKERIFWLRISAFVSIAVLVTIFNWQFLIQSDLIWLVVSVGLITTVIWWFWTMMIIRKLITFKIAETELLKDIVNNVQYVREKLQKNIE